MDRHGYLRLGVVALTVTLTLQSVRVLFPLIYLLGERTSFVGAGWNALAVFAAPVVAPLLLQMFRTRCLLVTTIGLATTRVVMQVVHPIDLAVAITGVVLGLIALMVLIYESYGSIKNGTIFMRGLVLGLGLDVAIRCAFSTWDPIWQEGAVARLTGLLLSGAAVTLAWSAKRGADEATSNRGLVWGVVAVGPFLWLHATFLNSPAFVASETTFSLPLASALILAADAMALALTRLEYRSRLARIRIVLVATGVLSAWLLGTLTGPSVAAVVLIAIPITVLLLVRALTDEGRRRSQRAPKWRVSVAGAVGTLAFAALVFAYQIHYDQPLPFSNIWLLPGATALLSLAAVRRVVLDDARRDRRYRSAIQSQPAPRSWCFLWELP